MCSKNASRNKAGSVDRAGITPAYAGGLWLYEEATPDMGVGGDDWSHRGPCFAGNRLQIYSRHKTKSGVDKPTKRIPFSAVSIASVSIPAVALCGSLAVGAAMLLDSRQIMSGTRLGSCHFPTQLKFENRGKTHWFNQLLHGSWHQC